MDCFLFSAGHFLNQADDLTAAKLSIPLEFFDSVSQL
jgi:hypothetical protein